MEKFTCDCCGESHEKGWSDEEKDKEAVENGFDPKSPDNATVCDTCYTDIMFFNTGKSITNK